jgi:hypothetical protein
MGTQQRIARLPAHAPDYVALPRFSAIMLSPATFEVTGARSLFSIQRWLPFAHTLVLGSSLLKADCPSALSPNIIAFSDRTGRSHIHQGDGTRNSCFDQRRF